jgi:hypothetical protein
VPFRVSVTSARKSLFGGRTRPSNLVTFRSLVEDRKCDEEKLRTLLHAGKDCRGDRELPELSSSDIEFSGTSKTLKVREEGRERKVPLLVGVPRSSPSLQQALRAPESLSGRHLISHNSRSFHQIFLSMLWLRCYTRLSIQDLSFKATKGCFSTS